MNRISKHFNVDLFGVATGLHFTSSNQKVLRDYEDGYIKEGVGAGALAFLAQLNGISCNQLVQACEKVVNELHGSYSK